MRVPLLLRFSFLLAVTTIAGGLARAQFSSNDNLSSPLKVDTTTTVPGADLKPGTYTIRVVDNLKDRYIFTVSNDRSKDVTTFIGMLQHEPLPGQGAAGPILWSNAPGKTNALRGFSFRNGHVFEFVYPKATAVGLAKINASSVPAIDPESEGMPVDPKLSPEDRRVVTLWLLTSTRIGPGKGVAAIEARRAQPKSNTESAQVWEPSPMKETKPVSAPTKPYVASVTRPDPDLTAKTKSRVAVATLPQTASDLPLTLLLSGLLLAMGFGIAAGRRISSHM